MPGAQSSARHAHAKQDEFIWVVEGELVLETNEGSQTLGPGICAGFAAGCGNAHRFVNRSGKDAFILVIGDRTPFDEIIYPDIDNKGHGRNRRQVRPYPQGRLAALSAGSAALPEPDRVCGRPPVCKRV